MPRSISTFSPGLKAGRPAYKHVRYDRLEARTEATRTSIRAARASERIPEVAVPTAAGRLRGSSRGRQEPVLLTLRNLHRLTILRTIEQHNLAPRQFLRLQLRKTARAVLACLLSPGRTTDRRLTRRRTLAVCGGQETLGINGRGGRCAECPQGLLRRLALGINLPAEREGCDGGTGGLERNGSACGVCGLLCDKGSLFRRSEDGKSGQCQVRRECGECGGEVLKMEGAQRFETGKELLEQLRDPRSKSFVLRRREGDMDGRKDRGGEGGG